MTTTDWSAIALAAIRAEYPRLPETLPTAVSELVDVVATRMSQANPGVTSQMMGTYSIVQAGGGAGLPLTALELAVLRQYRRARYGSHRTPSGVAYEGPDVGDVGPEQADYEGRWDL